ncbi:MAG: YARHG domain-containing protein [Lachnospiraceae bacterium]|jgi:hypothetical protein|nr:YARHG domain-containing protein [Lachnospiraceae bacterium]
MEKKSKGVPSAVIVILAVLIIAGIAACVMLKLQQGSPKLEQTKMQEKSDNTESETTQPVSEEKTYTESIGGFTVTTSGTTSNNDDSAAMAENGDYLCSYSAQRQITQDDINTLEAGTYTGIPQGRTIVQMVLNEMYARHGYQFSDVGLQNYFNQKTWYQAITERETDMDKIYSNMSEIEKNNIEFLSALRKE